jgi:hypothetical protein
MLQELLLHLEESVTSVTSLDIWLELAQWLWWGVSREEVGEEAEGLSMEEEEGEEDRNLHAINFLSIAWECMK